MRLYIFKTYFERERERERERNSNIHIITIILSRIIDLSVVRNKSCKTVLFSFLSMVDFNFCSIYSSSFFYFLELEKDE